MITKDQLGFLIKCLLAGCAGYYLAQDNSAAFAGFSLAFIIFIHAEIVSKCPRCETNKNGDSKY